MNGQASIKQRLEKERLQQDAAKKIAATLKACGEFTRAYDDGFKRKGGFPYKDPVFMSEFLAAGARVEAAFKEAEKAFSVLRAVGGTQNIFDSFKKAEKAFFDARRKEEKKWEGKYGVNFAEDFPREQLLLRIYSGLSYAQRTLVEARIFFTEKNVETFKNPKGADVEAVKKITPYLARLIGRVEKIEGKPSAETLAAINSFKQTRFYKEYESKQEEFEFASSSFAEKLESAAKILRYPVAEFASSSFAEKLESAAKILRYPVAFAAPFSAQAGEKLIEQPSKKAQLEFLKSAALDIGCIALLGKLGQTAFQGVKTAVVQAAKKEGAKGILKTIPTLTLQVGKRAARGAGMIAGFYAYDKAAEMLGGWEPTFSKYVEILFSEPEKYSPLERTIAARNVVNYYAFISGVLTLVPEKAKAVFRRVFEKVSTDVWVKGLEKVVGKKAFKEMSEEASNELRFLLKEVSLLKRSKEGIAIATQRLKELGEKYGVKKLSEMTEEKVGDSVMMLVERAVPFFVLAPAVLTQTEYLNAKLTDPKLVNQAWQEYGQMTSMNEELRGQLSWEEYKKLKAFNPKLTIDEMLVSFNEYQQVLEEKEYAGKRFSEYLALKRSMAKEDEFLTLITSDELISDYWYAADARTRFFNPEYAWIREKFASLEEWKQHYLQTGLPPDAEKKAVDDWFAGEKIARAFPNPQAFVLIVASEYLKKERKNFEIEYAKQHGLDPEKVAALFEEGMK